MTLSESHKKKRLNRVTSTTGADAIVRSEHLAARRILGIDDLDGLPFDTPIFLLRGQYFEESICNLTEHLMREGTDYLDAMPAVKLQKHPFRVHGKLDWLGASIDRVATVGGKVVGGIEAKSYRGDNLEEYGEPGTDHVDERTYYQCVIHMAVVNLPWCRVPLDTGYDFKIYHIERDRELEDAVISKLEEFYHRWVKPNMGRSIQDMDLPPVDASDATTDWIKARYRQHTEETLPPEQRHYELALKRDAVVARLKEATEQKKAIDNALRDEIGATGSSGFKDELVTMTWREAKGRSRTDWEALARHLGATHDQIAEYTNTEPGYRRLYVKLKKGAKERLLGGTMQQKLALEAPKQEGNDE